MKKPFIHALAAALYIVMIVLVMRDVISFLRDKQDTIVIPMTMLALFVLSAAVMGFVFLSEPVKLFIENRKQEAVDFFAKTVGFFSLFVAVFVILLFLV